MLRVTVCALALAVCVPVVRAGELDRESPAPAMAVTKTGAISTVASGSEMDRESPQSAHGWGWGRPYYGGWGWGGFYPARVSYFNIGFSPGFYRPVGFHNGFYNNFYGGFYNFSNFAYYRPFFPSYSYAPYYGWWW